jgi:protein SFI1
MGINLEIVESPEHLQHPPESSSSRISSASAAGSLPVDQTGTFSISPRYDVRRRRNSESAAPTALVEDVREIPTLFTTRPRSASLGSQHAVDELHRRRGAGDENQPPLGNVQPNVLKSIELEDGDLEQQEQRQIPIRNRPLFAPEDDTDDGFPYLRRRVDEYPESESEHVDEYAPSDIHERHLGEDYDLPRAEDVSDRFVGTSDTTALTSDEVAAGPVLAEGDLDVMEKDAQAFLNYYAGTITAATLSTWSHVARNAVLRHNRQEAQATTLYENALRSQCIQDWRVVAQAAKTNRLASQGPLRDPTEDSKLQFIAIRAYNLFLVYKVLSHWQISAEEEFERTAIARRHILRKRYFTTWRLHQADIESKIYSFRLSTLMRIWRRTAIHHEVRDNVAVQRYRHGLVKKVFDTWYDEYRARLADDLWACRLKEHCIRVWQSETVQRAPFYEDCFFYDQRFLQENAISIWRAAADELRMMVYGCTEQMIIQDLRRTLEDWRAQADLRRKLREFTNQRERQTKGRIIHHWLSETDEAGRTALLAETVTIQGFINHWRNETKLGRFRNRNVRELKVQVLSHWRSEQKLANYKRLCERRTKERVLARLRVAGYEAETEAARGLRLADSLLDRSAKVLTLGQWRSNTFATLQGDDTAADRHYFSVATSCIQHWYIRAGESARTTIELTEFTDRGAYYVATSNTLTAWAEITKQARRERLTRTYHSFRRRYKINLAARCLFKWREATHDSHALSYDADNVYGGRLRDELAEYVDLWRDRTQTMQAIREVAKGAEQEVVWWKWSTRAKELRDTELDAADYCDEQTLSRCWRSWEFATLQNKGKQHVVATLQENNDKRLCRQVLAQWSHKAAPERAYADLRSSVASRRSVRYTNVRTVEIPRFGGSVNPPSSPPPAQQLPPIDEDLGNIYTATPKRQHGRASEQPRNPFISAPPKELSQSLPQRPRGYFKHDLLPPVAATPQPPISSFPASAGVPPPAQFNSSVYMSAQQQPLGRQHRDTPYPPPGSTQQQQPPPRPDFDEDEISFAPSEGNDHPATFMSTPTRRTGTAARRSLSAAAPGGGGGRTQQPRHQQPPYRRPASVVAAATTTTPSAVLDTPFERALRREYGGGILVGDSRRSAFGLGRLATPRVTFADIREESREEGGYDDGEEGR